MSDANSVQIGGDHYKLQKIQHWDLAFHQGLGYFTSAATKYIERWKNKNGVVDLKKAHHYLLKERETWEGKDDYVSLEEYLNLRPEFDEVQKELFKILVEYETVYKDMNAPKAVYSNPVSLLDKALDLLATYIEDQEKKESIHWVGVFWFSPATGFSFERYHAKSAEEGSGEHSNLYEIENSEETYYVGKVRYLHILKCHQVEVIFNSKLMHNTMDLQQVINVFKIKHLTILYR